MKRRDFTRTMLGAGVAGTVLMQPGRGFANLDRSRDREFGLLGRIYLRTAAGQILVQWMLIAAAGGVLGLDLRQEMPQYREDGLGESDSIPLLGGLLRKPLNERFRGASAVANVVLLNKILFLLPFAAGLAPPRRVAIAHRDLSWEPAGRVGPVRMKNLPQIPELSGLPVIGQAFRTKAAPRDLLVIVNPSIVQPNES